MLNLRRHHPTLPRYRQVRLRHLAPRSFSPVFPIRAIRVIRSFSPVFPIRAIRVIRSFSPVFPIRAIRSLQVTV